MEPRTELLRVDESFHIQGYGLVVHPDFSVPNGWKNQVETVVVEKPDGHNILEGQTMVAAAKKHQRVVQLVGYVNAAPGFMDMPKVVNGASDLWVAIYGERGRHVRVALGVAEIARKIPVETMVTLLVSN